MGKEQDSNQFQNPEDYEVISLYDLIQILLKRKKLVILIFAVCVIAVVVGSLIMKPVYRVTAVLSPARYAQEGQIRYVSSPENLRFIISKGSFHNQVLVRLNWDAEDPENNIDIQTDLPQNTDNVYLSTDSADPGKASTYINGLIDYLIDYYDQRTRIITGQIKNSIKASEYNLEVLKEKEKRLKTQLKQMQENTADIMTQRDAILKDPGETETLPLLLYSNTIQQNMTYMDQLYRSLENNSLEQRNQEQKIDDLMLQLSRKDDLSKQEVLEKGSLEGLIVVQKPTMGPNRVKPNRTLMVAMAGVLGLFLGVFAAFFREFWVNQKRIHG